MKITKRQLKRIIREERAHLNELGIDRYDPVASGAGPSLTLASIEQLVQPLKDMIERHVVDDRQYMQAIDGVHAFEDVLTKIAEGGSGAPRS